MPSNWANSAEPITREMVEQMMERELQHEPQPHIHIVHPRADGWTICANCFQPLYIKDGQLAEPPIEDIGRIYDLSEWE